MNISTGVTIFQILNLKMEVYEFASDSDRSEDESVFEGFDADDLQAASRMNANISRGSVSSVSSVSSSSDESSSDEIGPENNNEVQTDNESNEDQSDTENNVVRSN